MKKIKRVGRLQPRGSVDFYVKNPDLFRELILGETIEVPDDVFPLLKGVVETSEVSSNFTKTSVKHKDKKSSSSKTHTQAYVEANLNKEERENRDGKDLGLNEPSEGDIVIHHEDKINLEDKAEDK